VRPIVSVSISHVAPIRVNVIGEVKTPATYELVRDRSVTAALAAAGWLTEFADRDRIFVVRREGSLRVRFRAQEITTSNPAVSRFRLSDGDVVVVE
jgi:polysaccharide biosynthesis/export protein